jgi:hypothetical protein
MEDCYKVIAQYTGRYNGGIQYGGITIRHAFSSVITGSNNISYRRISLPWEQMTVRQSMFTEMHRKWR